jgi:predicted metallo-beta-lactamase superfamily hydrolase
LEDLHAVVKINSAWETIRENIKTSDKQSLSYFELKKHKPWFDEGCSKLLDQRKQAKLQWLHDQSAINGDDLNNVRCEASRYFRNTDKINELATNSKNKNITDLYRRRNKFKRGYQPRNNLVKDENGDLLADSHNILTRSMNYFSQLLNVHNVSDVRQIEVHTAEPLVSGSSRLEVEIAIAKVGKV